MPFKYACFLSYRVGAEPGANNLYLTLKQKLAEQVDLYMPGLGIYLDRERLQGGDLYNSELAHALCHSVCMVVLFSPQYFDAEHTYCAREYQAMVRLEGLRLGLSEQDIPKGLIVPVIIRGSLPQAIREQRHSFSLSDHLLVAADLGRKPVGRVLRDIAELIYQRYLYQKSIEQRLCRLCPGFELPSPTDVADMIRDYTTPPKAMPW